MFSATQLSYRETCSVAHPMNHMYLLHESIVGVHMVVLNCQLPTVLVLVGHFI